MEGCDVWRWYEVGGVGFWEGEYVWGEVLGCGWGYLSGSFFGEGATFGLVPLVVGWGFFVWCGYLCGCLSWGCGFLGW